MPVGGRFRGTAGKISAAAAERAGVDHRRHRDPDQVPAVVGMRSARPLDQAPVCSSSTRRLRHLPFELDYPPHALEVEAGGGQVLYPLDPLDVELGVPATPTGRPLGSTRPLRS